MAWTPKFFLIQSYCMAALGCYFEKGKNSSFNRLRSHINTFMSMILLLSQFYAAREAFDDPQFLLDILGLVVGIFLSCIKIMWLHFQVNDFVQLNETLVEISRNVSERDRKILIRMNRLGQTMSLINVTCILSSTLILILYPLFQTIFQYLTMEDSSTLVWPTPFDVTLPFNASATPAYELVYLFFLYNFTIASFSINATDSMFLEAALLIVCHLEFLQRDMRNLNYDENFETDLKKIFNYHRRILKLKVILNKAYSRILPVYIVVAPGMFGLFAISAMNVRKKI